MSILFVSFQRAKRKTPKYRWNEGVIVGKGLSKFFDAKQPSHFVEATKQK